MKLLPCQGSETVDSMLKGKELTREVGWGVELVTGIEEGGVGEFLMWLGGGEVVKERGDNRRRN